MKRQKVFSGKNRKSVINLSSAELAQKVGKVMLQREKIYMKIPQCFFFIYMLLLIAFHKNAVFILIVFCRM